MPLRSWYEMVLSDNFKKTNKQTNSASSKGIVLEPQREMLRKHASIGHAEIAGSKMPVTFVGDGDPAAEIFIIDNFLLKEETAALLSL